MIEMKFGKKITNLRISNKLILSFGIVVFLLIMVIGYQIYSLSYLKELEEISVERYEASECVRDINTNLANMYAVFSDLLINRNFDDFEKNLELIKKQKENDMASLEKHIIDDEDRVRASDVDATYLEMIDLLESTYPVVRVTEEITGEIIIMDAGIDNYRATAVEHINYFIEKFGKDARDAAENFEKQLYYAVVLGVVLTIVSLILCGVMIFILRRYIVINISRNVDFAGKLANGDLSGRIPVESDDEFGHLAESLNRTVDNLESILRNIQGG